MNKNLPLIAALIPAPILVGCDSSDTYDPDVEMAKIKLEEGLDSPRLEPTDEGFAIPARSDPKASYRVLKVESLPNGNIEVLSRRDGLSGTSFARREIDCGAYKYRYLGEGDTREDALTDTPSIGKMTSLTGTSASSDVANAACSKVIK